MIAQVIDDIMRELNITDKDVIDRCFADAMTVAHLYEAIPCPHADCDLDLYARTYEKVESELMFGDGE
jgi:hypothetical protein